MIRIAIADDDAAFLAKIEKYIQKYQKENGEDIQLTAFSDAKELIEGYSPVYDIVILDEINVALACGLLPVEPVVEFLRTGRGHTEVIATGCWAPPPLIDAADLVTEMKNIRHPYSKGIDSREGIDH